MIFVFVHILGVVIFIPVLAFSPKRDVQARSPLIESYNPGGWASSALATMIGSLAPASALIGFDCSVHMGMSSLDFYYTTVSYLLI